MAVAAGVVGRLSVSAFGTNVQVPAQRCSSAGFNRPHHFAPLVAQRVLFPVGPPVDPEDVSDLQARPSLPTCARAGRLDVKMHALTEDCAPLGTEQIEGACQRAQMTLTNEGVTGGRSEGDM